MASDSFQNIKLKDNTIIKYQAFLPKKIDPDKILLHIPMAGQTDYWVRFGMDLWEKDFKRNGWLVISPSAPDDRLFFRGSEVYIPEFLEKIEKKYSIKQKKWHLFGVSNGAISSFRIATLYPYKFRTLTSIAGLAHERNQKRFSELEHISVAMFIGSLDHSFYDGAILTYQALEKHQIESKIHTLKNKGHKIALDLKFDEISFKFNKGIK